MADVVIIGGMGNFDVPNHEGGDCNEFEIELEGPHPEDVYHTYHNPNYGPPTITALPGNIGIRVVYNTPQHATHPNTIEHFGVSLSGAHPTTAQRFRWILGSVVNPNDPPPLPPPPPPPPLVLPNITVELITLPDARRIIRETVTNVDTAGRMLWVRRRVTVASRHVTLEELMPNDPLIQGATDLGYDEVPVGTPLINDEGAPNPGDLESAIVAYEVYKNTPVMINGSMEDAPGDMIGNLLTAQISLGTLCGDTWSPVITMQPQNVVGPFDGSADFAINLTADPDGGELIIQWQHEGVNLEGEDQPFLNIDPVMLDSAGSYVCMVTNDCGIAISHAATLTVAVPVAVDTQPQPQSASVGGTASFIVEADSMLPPTYTWMHDGVAITPDPQHYTRSLGSNGMSSTLTIRNIVGADAGAYTVRLSSATDSVTSDPAALTVQGGGCAADFDANGVREVPDIFAFLSAWFAQDPRSDFDHSGTISVPDIFAFLSSWFAGCP